jgi:hypothetical protein
MKKLLTLALVVLSANSFAQINHGRLIKHQEWTTGDARVVFKSEAKKALKSSNEQRSVVLTYATLYPAKASTGVMSNLTSHNGVTIANDTEKAQTYDIEFGTCVDTGAGSQQCGFYEDEVELQPNGTYELYTSPELNLIFDKQGSYKTQTFSFIQGVDLERIYSTTENTVEVS